MITFVDKVKIFLSAGNGGNGSMSIRREKYKPLAGPNGGNGGNGGNVILRANSQVFSLLDFHYASHFQAENGTHGKGSDRNGKNGDDIVLDIPVGTTVKVLETDQIIDITADGEEVVIAKGGKGGLGNAALATAKNKAPHFALLGEPGEKVTVNLELKLITDVALIGYPSCGKSSLISVISKAKPKIADYPFTTLIPNLGVVSAGGYRYIVSDIPGLIEGASEGKGLGLEFLRHIERASVLAHVVDMGAVDSKRDPVNDIKVIENELKKYSKSLNDVYKNALYKEIEKQYYSILSGEQKEVTLDKIFRTFFVPFEERPRIIILNKMDLPDSEELKNMVIDELKKFGWPIFETSAITRKGLDELVFGCAEIVKKVKKEMTDSLQKEILDEFESYKRQEKILLKAKPKGEKEFTAELVENEDERYYRIQGEKIDKWIYQTDFQNSEAADFFENRINKIGVNKKLVEMGIKEGDEVRIGNENNNIVFDWKTNIEFE